MNDLLEQFLIEGRELVQQASDDLMALEHDPSDPLRIDSAFRVVHTLKASVALFDFVPMGKVMHAAEDLLGAMRAGQLVPDRSIIDVLFECIGAADLWIEAIARTGVLPGDAEARGNRLTDALLAPIRRNLTGDQTASAVDLEWLQALLARNADVVATQSGLGMPLTAIRYAPAPDSFFLGDDPLDLARQIPELLSLHVEPREPWVLEALDPFRCNLVIEALSSAPAETVRPVFRFVSDRAIVVDAGVAPERPDPRDTATQEPIRETASRLLRVDVSRIDTLVDIVGELVVAKNGLAHLAGRAAELDSQLGRALGASQADIQRLIEQLHRAVLGVRMTPLAQTFRRLPRLVRETASRLEKEVQFEIAGDEVEADKTIVDALFEPLLHALRNALDPGVELPAVRTAAGKAPRGRIALSARQDGSQIVLTVTDDGAGIDVAKIRQVAKARGVMPAEAIDALNDAAATDLIFAPGFSTADAVTDISGRGVGMDFVRTAIEALGGRATIASTPGQGTELQMVLPQGVTIGTVMTVLAGGDRFGVPMEAILETARVANDRITVIGAGEAFALRDSTVPLLRLAQLLDLPPVPRAPTGANVLVVDAAGQRVGIEVDGFAERTDLLLRPLSGLLAGMPGLLGTSVTGDGRVLMILNLPELVR